MQEFSRGIAGGGLTARRAAQRLVESTRDGSSIEISAGGESIRIKSGAVIAPDDEAPSPSRSGVAADRLHSFVERIERLEEDKAALIADIKEVYAMAKGEGFDAPTLRMVVRERKKDKAQRDEQLSLFDLYWSHLGEV